jgi:hypothetical protein
VTTDLSFVGRDGAGKPVSLRELLVHMIEEYARHKAMPTSCVSESTAASVSRPGPRTGIDSLAGSGLDAVRVRANTRPGGGFPMCPTYLRDRARPTNDDRDGQTCVACVDNHCLVSARVFDV